MQNIKVKRLSDDAILPTRAHKYDAGLDVYSIKDYAIEPGQGVLISTGVAFEIEPFYFGLLADRSSMAKRGLTIVGGIIDESYVGECAVLLRNMSGDVQTIRKGDRVAQIIFMPIALPQVIEVNDLKSTTRGEKGFGSSGR